MVTFVKIFFGVAMLAAATALCGCSLEASHELSSSSPLPRGVAHDPRAHALGRVRVTTDSYTDGTVVATVTSLDDQRHFKIRGIITELDPPSAKSQRWREIYNGESDVFEYVLPDTHYIRVVENP